MDLLERTSYLDTLNDLHRQAAGGHGRMLLLGGEAGVGKTSLAQTFADQARPPERVLVGHCEPLSAPRPHGLLSDMDELMQGQIGQLLDRSASPAEIARAVLSTLSHGPTTIMIIEDAHWIDDAAVDGLRYLGRRIGSIPLFVIITFRDDEIGKGQPLRRLLGDLATAPAVSRMHLPPLSLAGVAQMTEGTGIDPVELFRLTNGNPFFISEVIANAADGLPATVRDAVLARVDRLSPASRHLLETVAVIGSPAESWLVSAASQSPASSAEECSRYGLLISDGASLSFRHELTRAAVLEATSAPQQLELHRTVLAELRQSGSHDVVRMAHHAAAAFDRDAVLEYGPAAAQRAAAFKSHREAAAQYERVMHYAGAIPPARRAELLMDWSFELFLMDRTDVASEKCLEALAIWRAEGDRLREGDALRWLARTYWYSGRNAESEAATDEALAILETLPPGRELAMAYSAQAQLRMLAWDTEAAIALGENAVRFAEELGETETLIYSLTGLGTALFLTAELERGRELLYRSLNMARQARLEDHAGRAYGHLVAKQCQMYRFVEIDPLLAEGIEYCTEFDLDYRLSYLLAWRGLSQFYQGHWEIALEQEHEVLRQPGLSPVTRIIALTALGQLHTRRGDRAAAMEMLDDALERALRTGELQRICPVRNARAEWAWLSGDLDLVRREAASVFDRVQRAGHRWCTGELAYWLWRADALERAPENAFEPYLYQIEGRWREAAAAWRELSCPYEAAWALADSNSEPELRYAHVEFTRLGAGPAAAIVTQRLRALGVERLPRGPRPTTQANPCQLTSREMDVLELIVQHRRTQEIADTLFLSPRTVGHHITAILNKLEVHSREEAARKAMQLGIVSQTGNNSPLNQPARVMKVEPTSTA